jgi:hypothetical protein
MAASRTATQRVIELACAKCFGKHFEQRRGQLRELIGVCFDDQATRHGRPGADIRSQDHDAAAGLFEHQIGGFDDHGSSLVCSIRVMPGLAAHEAGTIFQPYVAGLTSRCASRCACSSASKDATSGVARSAAARPTDPTPSTYTAVKR